MDRVCEGCGAIYNGKSSDTTKRPACVLIAKQSNVVRTRTCRECAAAFDGGPRAWYCPDCRRERKRAHDRGYRRRGPARKLGSKDFCVCCGAEYTVKNGHQKYCPECSGEAIKEIDRKNALEYYHQNKANINPVRNDARRVVSSKCVICGKIFAPTAPSRSNVCSPECRAERKRQWQRKADARRRPKKQPTPE